MKKRTVYIRTLSTRLNKDSDERLRIEYQHKELKEKFAKTNSNLIIESRNFTENIKIKQFMRMLQAMKKYEAKTIIMTQKDRISNNDDEVYQMCKLAEDEGIEIQFVKEKINSKDIIKVHEENLMTGMEMNL